jgi:hypothetical protein
MGAGNMAPYWKDSVWYPGNYSRWEMLDNGPLRTSFRLYYDEVLLNGHPIRAVKTVSLDAGTYMNRISVVYSSPGLDSIPVVVGIATRKEPGVLYANEQSGLMSYWEPAHRKYGTTGVAVSTPRPGRMRMTPGQLLYQTSIRTDEPYVYHAGACWDREGVITDERKWTDWVRTFHDERTKGTRLSVKY